MNESLFFTNTRIIDISPLLFVQTDSFLDTIDEATSPSMHVAKRKDSFHPHNYMNNLVPH